MKAYLLILGVCFAFTSALPTNDPVIRKLDPERYHYVRGPDGTPHLVDLWVKASDLQKSARYNADNQNEYHLFSRANPTVSQPLVVNSNVLQGGTNFNPSRRTVVILHGWLNSATAVVNAVLVPSFLAVEDVNVIVVDWSAGADTDYVNAVINTVTSGRGVARFITQLNAATGAALSRYVIVGFSLGGHQAGIIGRNLNRQVPYVLSLDPAGPGWNTNSEQFHANDGVYTEVIHSNAGFMGYLPPLGLVDFYPNGGVNMPGCDTVNCSHDRAFYYLAESLTSGGFTGRRCSSYLTAVNGNCNLDGTLRMGGAVPKTGSTGIFHLETNAAPPFSRG